MVTFVNYVPGSVIDPRILPTRDGRFIVAEQGDPRRSLALLAFDEAAEDFCEFVRLPAGNFPPALADMCRY